MMTKEKSSSKATNVKKRSPRPTKETLDLETIFFFSVFLVSIEKLDERDMKPTHELQMQEAKFIEEERCCK